MLNCTIRNHKEYTVSLYADDLILYVMDLVILVPAVLHIFNNCSHFSGYKLICIRVYVFPLLTFLNKLPYPKFPYQISHTGFKKLRHLCYMLVFWTIFWTISPHSFQRLSQTLGSGMVSSCHWSNWLQCDQCGQNKYLALISLSISKYPSFFAQLLFCFFWQAS